MKILPVLLFLILVGCSQTEDPEKVQLRNDCAKFQQEINYLNGLLSAEKTPQVEMVEKMNQLSLQHKKEVNNLQGKITQLNNELVEKEVSPVLAGLQVKLKELDKRDIALTAEVAKLYKLCKDLEDNKSNRGHGH